MHQKIIIIINSSFQQGVTPLALQTIKPGGKEMGSIFWSGISMSTYEENE